MAQRVSLLDHLSVSWKHSENTRKSCASLHSSWWFAVGNAIIDVNHVSRYVIYMSSMWTHNLNNPQLPTLSKKEIWSKKAMLRLKFLLWTPRCESPRSSDSSDSSDSDHRPIDHPPPATCGAIDEFNVPSSVHHNLRLRPRLIDGLLKTETHINQHVWFGNH